MGTLRGHPEAFLRKVFSDILSSILGESYVRVFLSTWRCDGKVLGCGRQGKIRIPFLLLLPVTLAWGVFSVLASDTEGWGLPGRVSTMAMIGAVATVVLDVILVPTGHSAGAAVASSISYGIVMILAASLYSRMTGTCLT
jgi:hypothetical protein